jgi:predicted histone-like DNA-binding protein
MSIKFKVIERGQPGVAGGGEKKYYANAVSAGELTLDGMTRAIEKTSTVNGADIRAVLYAMVEEAVENLSEGRIVRLGELGSLRVSLSSEGSASPAEVTAARVKSAGVVFSPGANIKKMLASATFTRKAE